MTGKSGKKGIGCLLSQEYVQELGNLTENKFIIYPPATQ